MRRRIAAALALLVIAIAGIVLLNRGAIGIILFRRAVANSIFRDTIATLPNGLHAGFCGTGSPFPSLTRSGPCLAVVAGERLFIVDAGRGAADMIARMGLQSGRIEAVLMTHYH